jgi:Fe-S cluster assembly protein SufD
MNVAVMKTRVEQALSEQFERLAAKLPGGAAVAEARRQAIGRFAALGLPSRRVEEWKYTDLRNQLREPLPVAVEDEARLTVADLIVALGPLAHVDAARVVFVNGRHRRDLGNLEGTEGIEVAALGAALATAQDKTGAALVRSSGPDGDAVLQLNTAYMTDGAVVRVGDGVALAKPLLVVFLRAGGEGRFVATRNVVSIGKGASATLVEAFVGLPGATLEGQHNAATEMVLGAGAKVTHVKIAADAGKAVHLSNAVIGLGADAVYRGFQQTQGLGLARNQIFATYHGEGARLDLSGLFLARGTEHLDTTLVVDHAVPRCESRELYKGVLDGEAKGIFQGKVIVRPDAQKSDGKQMAQALMLSPDAEFDSKPELEIYADDVVCGHGSTAAELDTDLLFYLRARGIPLAEARALLIESFVGEALDKIEHDAVREAAAELARGWLARLGT